MNYQFSIVVTNKGEVYSWGLNNDGQLGVGNKENQNFPTLVSSLSSNRIRYISCGRFFAVALSDDHEVYSWGNNKYGQLGNGGNENQVTPAFISSLKNKQVTNISCGLNFVIAITENKSVYSWGYNGHGQLGLGNTVDQTLPQLVSSLTNKNVKQISCGDYHTLAVSDDGKLYSWGGNGCGQLGVGKQQNILSPQLITDFKMHAMYVCCGGNFSIVYTSDHGMYSCGHNHIGQLGLGHQKNQWNLEHIAMMEKIPMIAISCGFAHVAVLTVDNRVYTWGGNVYGQLGLGDMGDRNTPQLVEQIPNNLVSISCGRCHTVALTQTGHLFVWGWNEHGSLGIGSNENQNKPHLVSLEEVSMLWNSSTTFRPEYPTRNRIMKEPLKGWNELGQAISKLTKLYNEMSLELQRDGELIKDLDEQLSKSTNQ